MKRLLLVSGLFGLCVAALATAVQAQGLLIVVNARDRVPLPRPIPVRQPPPMAYKIKELAVQARVTDQVARVQVSQAFVNTGSQPMEVAFVFPLPYDGTIDRMTFLVDGREIPAKLLPAAEARSIYEGYVRRNRDPALLEWIGTGMFQTNVFPVPPGAERKVTLRYSQLLRKDHSLTDFLFPLSTAKYTSHPVEKVEIQATIESATEIKSVYSPTHAIEVKRPDSTHAVVTYTAKDQVPMADFRLFYDVAPGLLGASVLGYRPEPDDDGYLLLLASPQIKPANEERPRKTVVCVFDRSGSMSGKKIEQAKGALRFVLNNLREGDLFNIVAYDTELEAFRPELQRFTETTRKEVIGFAEGLYAGGGTNISGALRMAFGMLQDSSNPSYVLFMTDGLPTVGELSEAKILEMAKEKNAVRARLISFGVGYDVNSRLLDRLCRANHGRSEYVRPDEDIEVHVSRLFQKIGAPVMTDVAVKFDFDAVPVESGPPVNRIYPREITDLFEGEQLVLVARYKKVGPVKVTITGRIGNHVQKFDFPASLAASSPDQSYAFVEKLWAMRRMGQIIDELDMKGRNDELIKELVALSTKHGILTPYTSFLADENAAPRDLASHEVGRSKAGKLVERLSEVSGKAAFAQRATKNELQEALHTEVGGWAVAAAGPTAQFRDIDSDRNVATDSVRVVGNQALYRRGNVWYAYDAAKASALKPGEKVQVIDRFTDEYFRLVREHPAAAAPILAGQKEGEAVQLHVEGKAYEVK